MIKYVTEMIKEKEDYKLEKMKPKFFKIHKHDAAP